MTDARGDHPGARRPGGGTTCPICGRGELVDIIYTAGSSDEGVPIQGSDTHQVETYSCGHEREGPRLDESASPQSGLDVERRSSDDTVDPPAGSR